MPFPSYSGGTILRKIGQLLLDVANAFRYVLACQVKVRCDSRKVPADSAHADPTRSSGTCATAEPLPFVVSIGLL
jgi:hypothetical protein